MTDNPESNKRASISRRDFMAAGAISAAMVGLGGIKLAKADRSSTVYLRPPGIASESDLLATCDRCQRCVMACPYDIVQPLSLDANIVTVGTPVLNFKTGYCTYCNKCIDVCPTGALAYDRATSENLGVAKVIKDVCVAWDWMGCTVCKDVCPVQDCIVLDENNRPIVNESLCNGCGLCEQQCPSSSLRSYDSTALGKGIFVVPRNSQVAHKTGAVKSDEFIAGANVMYEEVQR